MANNTQLTAQQKAQLFNMSTRHNQQMLSKETATSLPKTLTFNLPKSRLLSSLLVHIKCDIKDSAGGSGWIPDDELGIYNFIRRISVDLNNGFQPLVSSGKELAMLNMINRNSGLFATKKDDFNKMVVRSGSYGFDFFLPINVALNTKDPIGLVLLQSEQTNCTLSLDLGMGSDIAEGVTISNLSVEVMTETFSIPADNRAMPDLSTLKLVNGRMDSLPSAGNQTIKLTTGTIYRKLILRVYDEDENPVEDDFINSPISLVFNQADTNYNVEPVMLRAKNALEFGDFLPKGMYVFDFSSGGGIPDLGTTRDYIDTANLNEFWVRFTTIGKGKVEIVQEHIARLV